MNVCRIFLAAIALAAVPAAAREPSTQATSAPSTRPAVGAATIGSLIDGLGDRDALVRERARGELMLLTRDDLPALTTAAAARMPLKPTQRSLLRDVVIHVYITGKHNFTGTSAGYLGISAPPDAIVDAGHGALVHSCLIGYDGYRVLKAGDVITSVARPESTEPVENAFRPAADFVQLRALLNGSRAGEWIDVRFVRDGAERQDRIRLGPKPDSDRDVNGEIVSDYPEGERYWARTFEPALTGSTTKPAHSKKKS